MIAVKKSYTVRTNASTSTSFGGYEILRGAGAITDTSFSSFVCSSEDDSRNKGFWKTLLADRFQNDNSRMNYGVVKVSGVSNAFCETKSDSLVAFPSHFVNAPKYYNSSKERTISVEGIQRKVIAHLEPRARGNVAFRALIIDTLLGFQGNGKDDSALDFLYDKLEEELFAKNFEKCDLLFRDFPVKLLNPGILLGVLTLTANWKHELSTHDLLYELVQAHFGTLFSSEKVERLLLGLK